MNAIYRLIWNERNACWIPVPERARARGKRASGVVLPAAGLLAAQIMMIPVAQAQPAAGPTTAAPTAAAQAVSVSNPVAPLIPSPRPTALPQGGKVVAGQAGISEAGATMTINQSTERAAIDWNRFDVGSNARVNFVQPSSNAVTLNRVQGNDASRIFGRITANGQVFLSNPNGVYFAPGASVDVAGLVATTHRIGVDDFMAGRYRFERSGATGSVINAGELKAALGGYIALLAPEVRNQGVILARLGTAALAAGEAFDLQFDSSNTLASLRVTPATIRAIVDNQSAVLAPGGLIILSAQAVDRVQGGVIRNTGQLEATRLAQRGGRIVLEATDGIVHAGSIDASGKDGKGGSVTLTGEHLTLAEDSRIDASGASGGGQVRIGGDWQGSGDLPQATTVTMADSATIDASATIKGDGGKVVLWSDVGRKDSVTRVGGRIRAASAGGGKGGKVETSGHALAVDASAEVTTGAGGEWLLDPADVTISTGSNSGSALSGSDIYPQSGQNSVTVNVNTVVSALNSGNVTITTQNSGAAGAGNGDIFVNAAINKTGGNESTLSLRAARDVRVNQSITSSNGKLNVVLLSDWDSGGAGAVFLDGGSAVNGNNGISINTRGGHLWVGGNSGADAFSTTTWNGLEVGNGAARSGNGTSVYEGVNLNKATIDTAGGSVSLFGQNGRVVAGEPVRYGVWIQNGSTIRTGAGTITVRGEVLARTDTEAKNQGIQGVTIFSSALETSSGDIDIRGHEIGGGESHSYGSTGINLSNARIETTAAGGGNITLTGASGAYSGGDGNPFRDGIRMTGDGNNARMVIRSNGGNINITGTSGASNYARSAGIRLRTLKEDNADSNNGEVQIVSRTGNVSLTGDTPDNADQDSTGVRLDGTNYGKVRIGYDGTNPYWGNTTITGRSVRTNDFAANYLLLQGGGALTIQPNGNDFLRGIGTANPDTLDIHSGMHFGSSHSALTFGKDTGAAGRRDTINVTRDLVAAGPIALHAKAVNLAANLTSTQAGAGILLRTSGHIKVQTGRSLTTDGGAITLWADTDASNDGYIQLLNNVTLDSRTAADRAANNTTAASGGGAITLGGGTNLATGYATADGLNGIGGINLGDQTVGESFTNQTRIYSGGGKIVLRGQRLGDSMMGINWYDGGEINAGNGTISLTGTAANGSHGIEIGAWQRAGSTATLIAAGGTDDAPAISITGTSNGSSGVQFASRHSVQAQGAGGVTVTGSTTGASSWGVVGLKQALSASGPIIIDGGARGVEIGGDSDLGARAGSNVTSSTANVTLTGDRVQFGASSRVSTTGALTVLPSSTSFTSAMSWPMNNLTTTGITGLTLGKAGNIANITVASATSINGPISLYGGDIAINAGLTATGANSGVLLQGSGSVTDGAGGFVSASTLRLSGGNVLLDSAGNAVGTLAASGVGSLTYRNATALTLGTVGGTNGIAATGAVDVATLSGDLTVARDVTTGNTSNTAITLTAGRNAAAGTAAGGDILVTGAPVISTGSGGRATLYTGSVAGSSGLTAQTGSGSGRFRYNSDETSTNYTLALGTGLYAIYRQRPTITGLVANDATTVYGDSLPALTSALVGSVNGDTGAQVFATAPTVTVTSGPGNSSAGRLRAGSHTLTASAVGEQLGYAVTHANDASGTLTVSQRTLAIGFTASSRVYDGSTAAAVASSDDRFSGDQITIGIAGASFADANAGNGKPVAITGIALAGADAANYTTAASASTTAAITPRLLTVSAGKVYDGTTALDPSAVALGNLVGGETLTISGATANDAHVATAGKYLNAITLGDGAGGGLASNYQLPTLDAVDAPVTITPRPLGAVASIGGTASRVYDGTRNATGAAISGTASGAAAGDTVTLDFGAVSLAYDSPNVVSASRIAATGDVGFTIGSSASNSVASDYRFTAPALTPLAASITPVTVTLSASKVYDGTTALAAPAVTLGNLVGGETLTISGATANDAHVATAGKYLNAVTLGDGADGGLASNYRLPTLNAANAPVTIEARPLSAVASIGGATSRVYDGTRNATGAAVSGTVFGAVAGDMVTLDLGGVSLAYDSPNVIGASQIAATGNVGFAVGSSASGSVASDYRFTAPTLAPIAASITPRTVALSANKVYDGSTTLAASAVTLGGLVGSETLAISDATANDARVATAGKYLTAITLGDGDNGGLGSNYRLPTLNAVDAPVTITPRPLNVSFTGRDKVYDGNTQATVTSTDDRIAGDTLTVTAQAAFGDKNVGEHKPVTVSNVALSGADAGNYTVGDSITATPVAATPTTASITRLDTVTWVGGTSGNWFDPANWAGGAVPDLSNVANVVIPANVVVSFDPAGAVAPAAAGPVGIDSLGSGSGSGGSLVQTGGTLNVGPGGIDLTGLTQHGGHIDSIGSIHLVNFTQTGGTTATQRDLSVSGRFSPGPAGALAVAGNAAVPAPASVTEQGQETGQRALAALASADRSLVLTPPAAALTLPIPQNAPPALVMAMAPATALATVDGSAAAVDQGAGRNRSGVVVRRIDPDSAADGDGWLAVEVPDDMVVAGFGFALPVGLLADRAGRVALTVTLDDGRPLPVWLRFHPDRRWFAGATASAADLPVRLRVRAGNRSVRVDIASMPR